MPHKSVEKATSRSAGKVRGAAKPRAVKASHAARQDARKDGAPDLDCPEYYTNREISAVAFIQRVLREAQSTRHALLDRVRFLSFVSSQTDDFLMVRAAGLQDLLVAQVADVGPDGMTPSELLDQLRTGLLGLIAEQRRVLHGDVVPKLAAAGVYVRNYDDLTRQQREAAAAYFRAEVLPILTPLGVDPSHPFPHISNRSLNLAVTLRDPVAEEDLFARIKVPATIRRLVAVPPPEHEAGAPGAERPGARRFAVVWLEQLIAAHLDLLFPGLEVRASYPFRVLRDADIEIQSDEAGDLLETIEQELRRRRFGSAVNLCVQPEMPNKVRELLRENLELDPADVWEVSGPLGLADLAELTEIDRPDLKEPPFVPRIPPELRRGQDPFAAIRRGDLLLHHPYDSFASVSDFIEAAARDPQVLAIKQTLYRVGNNPPVVQSLLEASERGKQVAVLVELKARGDEENNIEWARTLERAGVHVVYGQVDLKTHAKVALVVRREGTRLRRYAHLGTGNYNAATARVYEDFALLTCRKDLCEDVANLFNALTGYARGITYSRLLVAPSLMRGGLISRIEREIECQRTGKGGRLIFKTNALVDPELVHALYRASVAGVEIDLIVRGMCSLRPGIPGVSDQIRVRSLVGRVLEHSRIYYFRNGGGDHEEVLLGSADLMQRNLDRRIEALFPIEDRTLRQQVVQVVLPAYLRDTANAYLLESDGTYTHAMPAKGEAPFDVQKWFAQEAQRAPDPDAPFLLQASSQPGPTPA